jgi:hypothetical protein
MRYLGAAPVETKGGVTGRMYAASERTPHIEVDARDARELLKSGQFEVMR